MKSRGNLTEVEELKGKSGSKKRYTDFDAGGETGPKRVLTGVTL